MAMSTFHIPDPGKEAKKAIEKIITPAITAGKHAVETVRDDAVAAVKDARAHGEWGVNHVRKEAEAALATVQTDAKRAIAEAGHAAADAVSVAGEDAEKAIHAAGDRAVEAFTEDLPKALHDLWKGLQSVVAGKVGDILFGIAGQVAPGHATVGLLFFEFEMQIKEQLPVLRKWIGDPPTSGNQVRDMLMDLAGDGVITFRPAKIPGLPYLGLDPRIPVKVEDVPKILEQVQEKMEDIL